MADVKELELPKVLRHPPPRSQGRAPGFAIVIRTNELMHWECEGEWGYGGHTSRRSRCHSSGVNVVNFFTCRYSKRAVKDHVSP